MVESVKLKDISLYENGEEITFPFITKTNKEINCKYSFVYKINYDFTDLVDPSSYNLPDTYYDKLGEIDLPSFDIAGYQFSGWYDIDSYGNYTKKYTKLDGTLENDINLKAKFLKKYNVTLSPVLDNVDLNSDEVVTYTEEDLINLPTPEKEGFIFDDWYYDAGYNVKVSKIESDMTIYAKWDIEKPTINLSNNIDKDFDNIQEDINVSAVSDILGVQITYAWQNSDGDIVSNILKDQGFEIRKVESKYKLMVLSLGQ